MTAPRQTEPLAIDLFCGLGGWTEGLLAEGYQAIGFDNERHVYGEARYPGQLVMQDVLTLHGAQFKDAALIVASPPCQAYSYRAMPWKRAKALPPPSNELFEACFRIQREANDAADHFIPLVVENVCGAQKWVGRARWHFGSFYLWGDVPALMPITMKAIKGNGGPWFKDADTADGAYAPGNFRTSIEGATKNDGGSWFAVAHNTTSGKGRNPDGRLHGLSGEATVGASVLRCDDLRVFGMPRSREGDSGIKCESESGRRTDVGNGVRFTSRDCGVENSIENAADGCKQKGSGPAWWRGEMGSKSSKSSKRKAASAHIAKIPYVLARHIGRSWYPFPTTHEASR